MRAPRRRAGFKSGLLGTDTTNPFADDKVTGIDTLRSLSKRTGGKYYSNIGSYEKNLAAVGDLTGAFYVLGYYPASAEDGKFHRVKVEVKRKGARVMAPSGFYDPKPFAEYTKLEKDLHLFDLALNERAVSRLPLGLPVTALVSGTADGPGLRVLARVPGEVTARFTGEKIEYVAIVFDDKGDIRDIRRGEADARSGRGRAVVFGASAGLGPGDYTCRVVVRDMDTGLSAVGSTKAAVRAPAAQGLRLWTPLLLAEETGTARVEAAAGKKNSFVAVGRDLRLRPDPFLARGQRIFQARPAAPGGRPLLGSRRRRDGPRAVRAVHQRRERPGLSDDPDPPRKERPSGGVFHALGASALRARAGHLPPLHQRRGPDLQDRGRDPDDGHGLRGLTPPYRPPREASDRPFPQGPGAGSAGPEKCQKIGLNPIF